MIREREKRGKMTELENRTDLQTRLEILLIEHDQCLADTFSAELEKFHARVHRAEELEEVFLCIEENLLDAVFIDVDHPGLDALHITRAVRKSGSNSKIPVIIMVSLDKINVIEGASKAGATHFLPKPIVWHQMHQLMASIEWRLTDERRQCRRARASIPVLCTYEGQHLSATSVDLSASGMLLQVGDALPVGREVVVAFPYGENYSVSFLLQAKVVRIIEDEKRGRLVAFEFYNIPEVRAQKLLMWVDVFLYFDEKTAH